MNLAIKDKVLYGEVKQETEIEMDKIIEEIINKFSYLEIKEYIHQNFDLIIKIDIYINFKRR